MSVLTTHFAFPWEARLPEIYRYLDAQYVDLFFKTGALRLSSLATFRSHTDEQRGDPREGLPEVESKSPNSEGVFLGHVAQEAYVLCGSINDDPKLQGEFGVDSGFVIHSTVDFAKAVAQQIPGFGAGMEGVCSYRANTAAQVASTTPFCPPKPGEDPNEYGRKLHAEQSRAAYAALFLKHPRFAHQAEYRMLWFANGEPKPHIDIVCPEALQFCRRLPGATS